MYREKPSANPRRFAIAGLSVVAAALAWAAPAAAQRVRRVDAPAPDARDGVRRAREVPRAEDPRN